MTPPLQPEEQARVLIDEQLTQAGWHVCDRQDIDLVNQYGNAVREVIMDAGHGRADYLLYVDKRVVGVDHLLEAAKPGPSTYLGVQSGLASDLRAELMMDLLGSPEFNEEVEQRSEQSARLESD